MTSAPSTTFDADKPRDADAAARELPARPPDRSALRRSLDAVVVVSSALFVFWQLHPDLILADTTPTGGDMGAHVWAFGFLRDVLLPDFRLSGWAPDWYAGFPMFQFYMVVPFLGMVVLNAGLGGFASLLPAATSIALTVRAFGIRRVRPVLSTVGTFVLVGAAAAAWFRPAAPFRFGLLVVTVAGAVLALVFGEGRARYWLGAAAMAVALFGVALPYGQSFKVVTVLGVVAMPVSSYLFGRFSGLAFPTPALLSVATLGFLFDKNFTIYGGNIASTMAGEFSFSISLALAIVYLGVLNRGLRTGRHRVAAPVLLALVGVCHLLPVFFALAATAVFFVAHLVNEWPVSGPGSRGPRAGVALAVACTMVAAGVAVVADIATIGTTLALAGVAVAIIAVLFWSRLGPDEDEPGGWRGKGRVWWMGTTGVVAGLLGAFWALPFFWRRAYFNDMGWEKVAVHREGVALWDWFTSDVWSALVPADLRVFAALALVGAVLSLVSRSRVGSALVVVGLLSATAFVFMPQGRLWNGRLLPFWYLTVYFLAAIGVGEVARACDRVFAGRPDRPLRAFSRAAAPVALVILTVFLGGQLRNLPGGRTNADGTYRLLSSVGVPGFSVDVPDALAVDVSGRNFVTDWARWNYTGYERKDAYPEYRAIVSTMETVGREEGCGMSLWESNPSLNDYGTPMALMLLPHWTDGCIGSMEGLYFESSSTTPYHFLTQTELSTVPSSAQRDLPYREFDIDAGVEHLQVLGVQYYLAKTPEAIAAARGHADLTEIAASGPWVVFRVEEAPVVQALDHQPVVIETGHAQHQWLCPAKDDAGRCTGPVLDWFQDPSQHDVALASSGPSEWQRVDSGEAFDRRPVPEASVSNAKIGRAGVSFDVDRTGVPVLVKQSYFPNWRVSGADGPYRVAPNLMVVVPTANHVSMTFGRTGVDYVANLLTVLGIGLVVILAKSRRVPVSRLREAPDEATASGPASFDGDHGDAVARGEPTKSAPREADPEP